MTDIQEKTFTQYGHTIRYVFEKETGMFHFLACETCYSGIFHALRFFSGGWFFQKDDDILTYCGQIYFDQEWKRFEEDIQVFSANKLDLNKLNSMLEVCKIAFEFGKRLIKESEE